MKLTFNLHLVPRVRMGDAILPLPQIYSWLSHGQLYLYPPYRQHGLYKQTTAERALGIKK